ncbi:hypothetical protein LIER_41523 [Lithospermum erythrorhizon]|uniref:Gag-protease polyprotein n=1 Tax=Lithospermum erythrorhizon TaxID=34254 RepID=A0AAV3RCP7_LITER
MSNEKLVRNVLRTLPKKFAHKVNSIEEAHDLTTMRLDELMGNLTTFEMSLDDGESTKKKGIPLKATAEDTNDEDLVETMNLLANNFNKTLKRFNKKRSSNLEQKEKPRGIQCRECDGFGHIQVECPNYVKQKAKNYCITLSDDDSKGEDKEEKVRNFVAFATQSEPPIDDSLTEGSDDEDEMTEEELLEDYKLLYSKWTKLTLIYTKVESEKG